MLLKMSLNSQTGVTLIIAANAAIYSNDWVVYKFALVLNFFTG